MVVVVSSAVLSTCVMTPFLHFLQCSVNKTFFEHNEQRIDFPVDEATVSVDEGTGELVFIGRDQWA